MSPGASSRDIYTRTVPGISQMIQEMRGTATSTSSTLTSPSSALNQQAQAAGAAGNVHGSPVPIPLRHRTMVGDAETEEPLHQRVVTGRTEPYSFAVTSDRRLGAMSPAPLAAGAGGTNEYVYRNMQQDPSTPSALFARDQAAAATAPIAPGGAGPMAGIGGLPSSVYPYATAMSAASNPIQVSWQETLRQTADSIQTAHQVALRKHFEVLDYRLRTTRDELQDALARQDDANLEALHKQERWASEASRARHRNTQLLNAVLGIAIFSLVLLLVICVYTTILPMAAPKVAVTPATVVAAAPPPNAGAEQPPQPAVTATNPAARLFAPL